MILVDFIVNWTICTLLSDSCLVRGPGLSAQSEGSNGRDRTDGEEEPEEETKNTERLSAGPTNPSEDSGAFIVVFVS